MLIKDIFNFEKGELQSSKNNHGKYDFITASSEWKTHDSFTHNCEALIFAMGASGSLGRTHYVNGKFIASDLCFILTVKDKINYPINLKFYHTIFNNLRENIVKKTATGTSKIAINKTNFGNYDILYCDIEEQIRIQKIIDDVGFANNELLSELRTQNSLIESIRKSILHEAVQGKLVPQDSNDEPASELLKRIKAEKGQLIDDKIIKKEKPLPEIIDDEIPYKLPNGWQWCRLNDLISILGDGLHGTPEYTMDGPYYFINGNNLKDGKIIIKNNTKRVSISEFEKYKKPLNHRTVFVSINGTLGNIAFYKDEKIMLGKSASFFNLLSEIDKNYIKLIIQSPFFIKYAFDKATGTTIKNLGLKNMRLFLVSLPSISEQKRIVAKVDELMNLCDQLENLIQESKENADMLMQSVLQEAFAA